MRRAVVGRAKSYKRLVQRTKKFIPKGLVARSADQKRPPTEVGGNWRCDGLNEKEYDQSDGANDHDELFDCHNTKHRTKVKRPTKIKSPHRQPIKSALSIVGALDRYAEGPWILR